MIAPQTAAGRNRFAPSPAMATVEWNASAGLAARRMTLQRLESLEVVADGKAIGRISRRDIERCEHHGNWLEAVMVADLIPERTDTCN